MLKLKVRNNVVCVEISPPTINFVKFEGGKISMQTTVIEVIELFCQNQNLLYVDL
jgi:hypothetical protein